MNDIDIFINILLACKHFFVTNIFFNSERKSILLNQFVNRPTTLRLNIHVISCDTYDIIYNHWASLLLSCLLHKVWATTGLTHCYFFRYFLYGTNQETERENANNFCFTSRTWQETNAAKERLLGFLFSFQHSEKRNVLVLNGFLCKQISPLAFDSIMFVQRENVDPISWLSWCFFQYVCAQKNRFL